MRSIWKHPDCDKRGITPEVAEARPYDRWTLENVEPVRQAYQGRKPGGLELDRHQVAYMVRLAGKFPAYHDYVEPCEIDPGEYGGWVINRRPPDNMRLPHVFAEIRPDKMVETGPPVHHWHWDGKLWVLSADPEVFIQNAPMTKHINRARAPDDHRGEPNQQPHGHLDAAKYLFPPTRKCEVKEEGNHAELYKDRPAALEQHLQYDHADDERVPGDHEDHEHVFMRKDRDPKQCHARRLDLHPDALERFSDPFVYFALEGCFKADSILSAGGAVFSVPSVTLWDVTARRELERFAKRYLRGKTVVIVCDADWKVNDLVVSAATSCATELRKLKVDAHVAGPPYELYELTKGTDEEIKGVDDFLGLAGGKLSELEIINSHLLEDPREFMVGRGWYRPTVDRTAELYRTMALHAGPEGTLSASVAAIARMMGIKDSNEHSWVYRAVHRMEEYEDIKIDGDLEWNRNTWTGRWDWSPRPTIQLLRYRAERSTLTVGDLMRSSLSAEDYTLAA